MVKLGRLINPQHQLCLAHGVQLAVIDVLYTNSTNNLIIPCNNTDDDENDDNNCDTEINDEEDFFKQFYENCETDITDSYNLSDIISKVRNIIRSFRKSPKKNDILQSYVKMDLGRELGLILDCKTRWSSLLYMLERFVLLEAPLKKATVDLKSDFCYENEFFVLKDIVAMLKPVELAVKALCQRDMNLCTAEAAILFMLNELQKGKSVISHKLISAIKKRYLERRTICTTLLNFLTKRSIESSVFESTVNLKTILQHIVKLLKRLYRGLSAEEDNSVIVPPEKENVNLEERLAQALAKSQNPSKPNTSKSLSKIIAQEMDLFINGGNRGVHLALVFNYLMTIPPKSVESERCFSTSGQIATKIRSSLNDETLDALVILKSFF